MLETPHAFFILDDHASGDALPAAPIVLKGWAVAKPGYLITDLRVKSGTRIHPVFYGHPRPDLAQYFKAREPFLLAGFEVELALLVGENRLEFQCCEIGGQWLSLATISLIGTPCDVILRPPSDTIAPHEFARTLRLLLQRKEPEVIQQAAIRVASYRPLPHVTRYPAMPFHGHLHHPPSLQRAEFGRLIVEGWLFHETEKIRTVAATVDLQAWQILQHENSHPYVAALFPQFPNAAACRIHGAIDVPSQLPQPLSVRVYAELEDGSWHLCHVERAHIYGDEAHKAPFVPFSVLTYWKSVRALRAAFVRRNLKVALDKGFLQALREIWQEYRTQAPRHNSPATESGAPKRGGELPRGIVFVTHNLNLEGAPLFLLELAAHLAGRGVRISIISAADGALREKFEALGAEVTTVDISPLLKAKNASELRAAIRSLAATTRIDGDLVIANTLSSYWGIHLAALAAKRSLFYIHESTTPDSFYFGYMAPGTLPVVKDAFAVASHVSFLTEATRRYYRPHLLRSNHSINPGWIDLARIDAFRALNSREQLRAQLGLPATKRLVVNIGSVCNRKGQHIFARSVDLLWRRAPELAAQCEFLMIGGRDTAYDAAIVALVGQLGHANLRVIRETPEPYAYYGAADLFVCSSYEESFPRVVLEAMAFELPIVSTDVHGIPEMARPNQEALLVPAGHSSLLADAMIRLLSDEALANSLVESARSRVVANYNASDLLPFHAGLCGTIAGQKN